MHKITRRFSYFIAGILLVCGNSGVFAQDRVPKGTYAHVYKVGDSTIVKIDSSRAFKIGDQVKIKMHQHFGYKPKVTGRSIAYLKRPLQDRIVAISDTLLKHLWPNSTKPRAYEPTVEERKVILETIGQLPKRRVI